MICRSSTLTSLSFIGTKSQKFQTPKPTEIMKITISSMFTLLAGAIIAYAQPTIQSFAVANTNSTEASLVSLDSQWEVPDTQVSTTSSVFFASKITLPVGTTSASITNIKFSVDRVINGVATTHLSDISMNGSSFTLEGSTSSPNVFARDSVGVIVPMSGTLKDNPIPNAKTIFITKHGFSLGGAFPKMIKEGDMWKIRRTVSVSCTVSAVTTITTLTTESTVVIWFYPTNPPLITKTEKVGSNLEITITGVTKASYGNSWMLESSVGLIAWAPAINGTVSGNTVVSFPIMSEEPKRFWRLGYTTNPAP